MPGPDVLSSPASLKKSLDAMSHRQRLAWIHTLTKSQLKIIWDTVAANDELTISYFHGALGEEVVYEGKNSLPVFSLFQKKIYRTPSHVQGYNQQNISCLTGPGAFVVRKDRETILFDYTSQIDASNERIAVLLPYQTVFHRIVYKGLIDQIRLVANDVVIGKAFRNGLDLDEYFILVKVPIL